MTTPHPIEVECLTCGEIFETDDVDSLPYQCDECGSREMHDEQQAVDDLRDERDSE